MRSLRTGKKSAGELKGNLNSPQAAMKSLFNSMTVEELRNSKPKSRLESFLRRKALEKKDREYFSY